MFVLGVTLCLRALLAKKYFSEWTQISISVFTKLNNNKIKHIILGLAISGTTLTACNSIDSMDKMVHDSAGYELGFPWHCIFGIIIPSLVVFIVYTLIKRNKSLKQ